MLRKSLHIDLVEPIIYLRGRPKDELVNNILRGSVHLALSKPAELYSATIRLVGIAKTLWPEAPKYWEKQIIVDTAIPVYHSPATLQKGLHTFPFEFALSNALCESIDCGLGMVQYKLHCEIQLKSPSSLFRSTIKARRLVTIRRLPSIDSQRCIQQVHQLDNNQLQILVESAHITPGSPLSLSIQIERPVRSIDSLRVKLIERQKFHSVAQDSTRVLRHEITLSPKSPLCPPVHGEFRCQFQVPDQHTLDVQPTTVSHNIRIRHWLQIMLKLTLLDGRQVDVSLDSPVIVFMDSIDEFATLPVYQPTLSPTKSHTLLPLITTHRIEPYPQKSWLGRFRTHRKAPDMTTLMSPLPPTYEEVMNPHVTLSVPRKELVP